MYESGSLSQDQDLSNENQSHTYHDTYNVKSVGDASKAQREVVHKHAREMQHDLK